MNHVIVFESLIEPSYSKTLIHAGIKLSRWSINSIDFFSNVISFHFHSSIDSFKNASQLFRNKNTTAL